jgi:hypothetical protein
LSESFQILKIQHIYWEFNREVDQRSKQALFLDEGIIYYATGMRDQVDDFERLSEF